MFEELFGNCPQSKVLDFFFSAPVDEYTKQQIAVGSGISRVTLDKFISKFIENEIILYQNSRYILNTKSEFIRKLHIAQEEFIKFHFNKQLEEGIEESEDVSDEELQEFLDTIPDELDFDGLEREIGFKEKILVNKREYENLKDYFLSFSNKEMGPADFSATDNKKWYMMEMME
ncbi:hypothetical protein [Methanobrevibacter sp.]|uniref:hypothetical protein n=1 Tax=Methanobrevibacter sp. TaxID=66852 RepID=UPI0025CE8035|nr:hypothetical protein [Methanobrevibacter sp.]MBQ2665878.1 hypothetical protein [Methanobrevibacter sp.]